jgi:hypothetical protein
MKLLTFIVQHVVVPIVVFGVIIMAGVTLATGGGSDAPPLSSSTPPDATAPASPTTTPPTTENDGATTPSDPTQDPTRRCQLIVGPGANRIIDVPCSNNAVADNTPPATPATPTTAAGGAPGISERGIADALTSATGSTTASVR